MRYLGHQFERQSRQERLAHYRKHPAFAHLTAPEKQAAADEGEGQGLEHRTIWQVGEPDDDGRAELRIVGPLDQWFGFEPDRIIEQLNAQELRHIHMAITSPGGYVELAQALYSDLRRRARQGVRITSEGLALVASAGLDLFLAGDERTASDDTVMMQHPIYGFTFLAGCKSEVKQQYEEMMSHMDAYVSLNFRIFRDRTGQSDETLNQWLMEPGEQWFSVEQAYEYGLITEKPEGMSQVQDDDDEETAEAALQQRASRLMQHAAGLAA